MKLMLSRHFAANNASAILEMPALPRERYSSSCFVSSISHTPSLQRKNSSLSQRESVFVYKVNVSFSAPEMAESTMFLFG